MATIADNTIQKADLPDTWREETRILMGLGIPMALTQLIAFAVYTIDVLMIGRISPEDLAAASLGTVIYFALWMVGSGPVMAVSPFVSQALGANQNDIRDVRRSVRMTLWAIFLLFPLVLIALVITEPVALMLGQDPGVSAKAGDYVLALALGWPFALATMALRNFLAALGKTKIPLILAAMTTVLNAGLNYLLIFGAFGFPRLELVGAGIASSLSYATGFFLFVGYITLDKRASEFELFKRFWVSDWPRLREIVSLGWPISLTTIFEGMLFNSAVIVMGLIGVLEVAAYQIAINLVSLAFMLPWGLSMAGAVRIGLARGARNVRAIKRSASVTLTAATLSIVAIAVLIATVPAEIAALYLDVDDPMNTDVIKLVILFLPIAATFMIFDAAQVAANQLLRGLKDVRWPMYLTGVSYWVIGFPIAIVLGLWTPLGAVGIWYGLTAGLMAASLLLGGRLYWIAWNTDLS